MHRGWPLAPGRGPTSSVEPKSGSSQRVPDAGKRGSVRMAVPTHAGRRKWMTAVVAATLFASLGMGTLPASAAPAASSSAKPAVPVPCRGRRRSSSANSASSRCARVATSRHTVFVQFAGHRRGRRVGRGRRPGQGQAEGHRQGEAARVKAQAIERGQRPPGARTGKVTSALHHDQLDSRRGAERRRARRSTPLAARSDVVKITPLVPKKINNSSAAAADQGASTPGRTPATPARASRVGIIDTGIDYTHADFGGPGTVAAWDAAARRLRRHLDPDRQGRRWLRLRRRRLQRRPDSGRPTSRSRTRTPTRWTATSTAPTSPARSPGYGVNADGSTFTGNYTDADRPSARRDEDRPGHGPAGVALRA